MNAHFQKTEGMPLQNKVDRIDLKILVELQKSGRITNQDLSTLVGISPSPCHKRVRRLERLGLVKGYRAQIYWTKLYSNVTILAAVSLKNHGTHDFQTFERIVRRITEITSCFGLAGPYDYMLRFDCADLAAYEELSREMLAGEVQFSRYDSFVVLREIKNEPVLPAPVQDPTRIELKRVA